MGLNVYDKLRKAASEKAKFFENERQSLIKLYDRLLSDLAQQAQLQDESEALQIKLKELLVKNRIVAVLVFFIIFLFEYQK